MSLIIKRTFETENERTTLTFEHSPIMTIGTYPYGKLVFGSEDLVPKLKKDEACIYQICAIRESSALDNMHDLWLYLQSPGKLPFREMEFVSLIATSELLSALYDSEETGEITAENEVNLGQQIVSGVLAQLEKNVRLDVLLEFLQTLVPFRDFIKEVIERAGEEYLCIDVLNRKVQLRNVSFSQKAGELFEQLLFTGTDNLDGNLSIKEFGEHLGQYYEHIAKGNTRERNDTDKQFRDWHRQYIKKVPA